MGNYSLQGDTYIIKNYDRLPAFSSFLPGLSGVKGIPLWVFYTNRGQGINSFGIHNKNNAIVEFNPANTAYENTSIKGFRTFVKVNGNYYEPFQGYDQSAVRSLFIRNNSFWIEEVNEKFGFKITVKYFCLPNECIGALVRSVKIENISGKKLNLELLDGLPKIIPYGIKNAEYKEMSNLLQSWTDIKNLEQNVPFYTLRASSEDSAEVSEIEEGGYFYLSIQNGQVLPVLYDKEVIFEYDSSLINPLGFMENSLEDLTRRQQCFANKIPCGFTPHQINLSPEEAYHFTTLIGFAGSTEELNRKVPDICSLQYLKGKEKQADKLAEELTQDVKTHTALPVFDQYIRQCYLDNFLRGGYPFIFNKDKNRAVIHLFSRKHGDPERDYNFFTTAGEYYSQGNGNFRDVCQNRRNDVFFQKDIGDFNIKTFFNLIQIDGYNPLEVRPSTFSVKEECKDTVLTYIQQSVKEEINDSISYNKQTVKEGKDNLINMIMRPFTPGQIANYITRQHIEMTCDDDTFLETLLNFCDQNIEAGYKEGYWIDHWDYNLDLIENYLSIYPERLTELLFEDNSYCFYDSTARVLPRSEKYVVNKGKVRQYNAVILDEEKCGRKSFHKDGTNWLKTKSGDVIHTSLIAKIISLALNKFSTLDSYGMGVEMEAGKPGWNDAMNGLPGLIGSSMAETFELKRFISFLCSSVKQKAEIKLPKEIYDYLLQVYDILKLSVTENWDNFTYWDRVSSAREQYRELTRFTLSAEYIIIKTEQLYEIFDRFLIKINEGIQKAKQYGEGIIPTYFTYNAVEYELVKDASGQPVISNFGLPKARVKAFQVQTLPAFLEGPARMLHTITDLYEAESLCNQVKSSSLYDQKLKMYKTSEPIEKLSMENGRIRAFTPGWLERESIFLHMEYKYLYSMLKAGLYPFFYNELKNVLIPFQDAERYGRSILENSSFIASSENPDSNKHGRGYVARLSGSTIELLSMWIEMFTGGRIFTYDDGILCLHFEPKLPGWLFDENGEASFRLLSKCNVTYRNLKRKDTFGEDAVKAVRIQIPAAQKEFRGSMISGSMAESIRNGEIKEILVILE